MHLLSFFLTTLVSLCCFVSAQAPGACTGTCQGMSHDPAVIRRASDGTYFRFSTANKINVATAPALQGPWTMRGSAIPAGSKIDINGRNGETPGLAGGERKRERENAAAEEQIFGRPIFRARLGGGIISTTPLVL